MNQIHIFVPKITNRIKYAFDLVLHHQLGFAISMTSDKEQFIAFEGIKFSYADEPVADELFFKNHGLLREREIASQELKPFQFKEYKAFFPVFHKKAAIPFDVFAAIFYLVSRYEEYLPFIRDEHGRFEASSSCLFELGILQKPIVNIWCIWLGKLLQEHFPGVKIKQMQYEFVPTYDIDAAWAYKNKGFYRSIGAYGRDALNSDVKEIILRTKVLRGKVNDPFDTFDLQLALQKEYQLRPIYFILFGDYGLNDKNISPRNTAFQKLLKQLADYADVGIHPSYASFNNKLKLRNEVDALASVLNREITKSRQHFLRMNLPMTYHHLIDLDIMDDYTMGYASQPGFRAGIANSFQFYDLDHDVLTPLRVHPITLMDGTLRDYMRIEGEKAMDHASELIKEVKSVGGTFVSLWHNETLSNQKRWDGWLPIYKNIIREALP